MSKIIDIDPSKVSGGLHKYAGKFVVLSSKNEVLGSGATYKEATAGIHNIHERDDVALFPVPEADVVLIPNSA